MNVIQRPSTGNAAVSGPACRSKQQQSFKIASSAKVDPDEFQKDLAALRVKNASVDQIKKTFRKMALRYHPDAYDPSNSEEFSHMFIELHKAYKTRLAHDSSNEDAYEEKNWEEQLSKLKRRSPKAESWASRMRL